MAFTVYSEEQDEWGYLAESTWGTAQLDSANLKRIKFPKGTRVEIPTVLTDLELNRTARQTAGADIHVDNFTGPARITVSEILTTKDRAADLLYACMQNRVSQGAATLYLKQYKFHLTQPDFTANAGYFFTLAWKGPVSAKNVKFASCIVKEMTLSFDKSGTGTNNLVKIKDLVILAKKHSIASTLSGTWVDQGTSYYNSYDFTYKYNDTTAMEWLRFALKIDNGAEVLDRDSDGTPKTFYLNWPRGAGQSAETTHWYNANTTGTIVDLLSDMNSGTERLYTIQTSATSAQDGHIKISFYGKQVDTPHGTADKQILAPTRFMLEHNSTTTNNALIIDIADSVSQ